MQGRTDQNWQFGLSYMLSPAAAFLLLAVAESCASAAWVGRFLAGALARSSCYCAPLFCWGTGGPSCS
eukprot:1160147-Pelagomonas_calceolata.AAC.1